jgi:hypothetical protein
MVEEGAICASQPGNARSGASRRRSTLTRASAISTRRVNQAIDPPLNLH